MSEEFNWQELCDEFGVESPDELDEDVIIQYIIEEGRVQYRAEWNTYINGWD